MSPIFAGMSSLTDLLPGIVAPWIIYVWITLLHIVLPARWVTGYVSGPDGKPLRYRLNGIPVLLLTLGAWYALGHFNIIPLDFLYVNFTGSLIGALLAGLVFTAWVVARAQPTGRGMVEDIWYGRDENPQWLNARVDAKMWLYLVGAVMLGLNILSALAYHQGLAGAIHAGYLLYTIMFFWFIVDYLFFERVHLWTYDFFAERVGFKLGWGCLTFYPYFYGVGLLAAAERFPLMESPVWLAFSVLIFLTGWILARGANMQKWTFKTSPDKVFLGRWHPETVSDGDHSLLVSGWWGLSRHINYLGEILMAAGLTLSLGNPALLLPWLYPLYYVLLLVPRQIDDDKRCAAKYGPLWKEYTGKVRWRIIPGIY